MLLVLTGADVVAEKIGGLTSHLMPEDFGAPKGHRTFQPLLVARPRPPRRRPRRLRRRRDADAGARRRRAGRGRLRAAAGAWSNIEDAAKPDAHRRCGTTTRQGNNAFRLMFGNKDATDAAFARPSMSSSSASRTTGSSPVSMEPRVAIGDYNAATDDTTRSTAPTRIRMARAWRSRTSSTCRRTASAWCRPTSAAASA